MNNIIESSGNKLVDTSNSATDGQHTPNKKKLSPSDNSIASSPLRSKSQSKSPSPSKTASQSSSQSPSRPKSPFITEIPNSSKISNISMSNQRNNQRSKSQQNSPMKTPAYESKFTDEELEEALKQFMDKKILPPFSMRDEALQFAKSKSMIYLIEENYDSAARMDKAIVELIDMYLCDSGNHFSSTLSKSIESRIEEVQSKEEKAIKQYEVMINELKEQEDLRFNELLESYEDEKKQFQIDCQTQEFIQQFTKPSNKLLQIRKIQKILALAHDFENAKEVKKKADELQRLETIEAQRNAVSHIKQLYEQMLEKQHLQIECFNDNKNRKIQTLMSRLENEKESYLKLKKQLELRLKEAQSKKTNLPQLRKSAPPSNIGQPSLLAIRHLVNYKKATEMSQLEIQLTDVNVKSVLNSKKIPSVQNIR
ncbi:hypothetical protein TRFO_18298 [Tritrichomonas foetus]|uniref:Uncharacterized protein n=1 Tax=Tritrichomonas foetus TaxID=1144522 RepID=A0A1J4KLJ5_9EUKA|nr:hypothetical protein TRFO_18298 [Tritrichomonas foetus]|eukprot:OHT12010.1 hypothetical protein TRFO_18298 [Tritrichomonas foetus]